VVTLECLRNEGTGSVKTDGALTEADALASWAMDRTVNGATSARSKAGIWHLGMMGGSTSTTAQANGRTKPHQLPGPA
jgi:hypothetical protein